MGTMEIFYLVLLVICLGSWTIYALLEYRKGKIKMRQRKKDEIRKKEKFRKEAPDVYEKIYKKKEER